jgi:hypothetical protein
VSEYLLDDGARQYESLSFFSPSFVMEAKSFETKEDFDIATVSGRIVYVNYEALEYDFKKATDKSRLSFQYWCDDDLNGNLRASRANCDHLYQLAKDRIVPHFRRNG